MSLLSRGQDVVLIWPEVVFTDSRSNPGQRKPADQPVEVRTRVQPLSSAEQPTGGQGVATLYRWSARRVPVGAWSRIRWDERDWDVVGEPKQSNGSPATRRVTVIMQARAPKAVRPEM